MDPGSGTRTRTPASLVVTHGPVDPGPPWHWTTYVVVEECLGESNVLGTGTANGHGPFSNAHQGCTLTTSPSLERCSLGLSSLPP